MADRLDGQLLVDLRACFGSNGRRGIGRFTAGLAGGLARRANSVVFFAPPDALDTVEAADLGFDALPLDRPTLRRYLDGAAAYHVGSLFELPVSADVIPQIVTETGVPVTATFYDAIPYAEPDRYQATPELRRWHDQRRALLGTCDRLLAISRYAMAQAVDLLDVQPERLAFVGAGVDERFQPARDVPAAKKRAIAAVPGLSRSVIVCVAGNDPRKNADGLIRGFAGLPEPLRETHQLVIVGRLDTTFRQNWEQVAADAGCGSDDVLFTGEIDDEALVALYQIATLSAFPSLNEGFGLPVAEAAACGCPTVCSAATAVPEVLGWEPSTFDPTDSPSITESLRRGLVDESFRSELRTVGDEAARRWRWDAVADRAIEAIADVGRSTKRSRRQAVERPRVALIGPFGGSPSGIGTYNERLLPFLDMFADVTCFVDKFWGEAPLGADGRRWPTESLGRHIQPTSFDHIVVTFGNSPFHFASSVLMTRSIPAHVWLHEANLAELHIGTVNLLGNQAWAETYLDRLVGGQYGGQAVDELRATGWNGMLDVAQYQRRELRLLGSVVQQARSVIVSSQLAADLVVSEGYTGDILVLPHAYPEARDGAAQVRPEIVVLGWLSTAKGADRVAAILAEVRQVVVDARLIFVGRPLDGALEGIERAAHRHNIRHAIELLGFLPEAELGRRLAGCAAGLRLSTRTDGEQSGAIADLVALGIPVVTNLPTMAPSSPGLTVLPGADDSTIADALIRLLSDATWQRVASADAQARASAWGFGDVAATLTEWLRR